MAEETDRWIRAAGLTSNNLSPEEANELDTLIFKQHADLPFSLDDYARLKELAGKARGD